MYASQSALSEVSRSKSLNYFTNRLLHYEKSKFSEAKRLEILAAHDAGSKMADLCREHHISPATLYNWKKEHKDDQDEDKRRLKQLEKENTQLKKIFAELSIDHDILKTGYGMLKKWQAQDAKKK